ncbi:hypothetical protein BDV98DRAFT_361217 [Pterulicium gracile]|uniref:Uncharacterized protein n=1 Tax=Pterulicium gracile TaxID=1884261 RepID=A0A5C3QUF2_9AGAR|nr:hypothetical protein BDV98DRAFT_361217 [Pterula gracilis]
MLRHRYLPFGTHTAAAALLTHQHERGRTRLGQALHLRQICGMRFSDQRGPEAHEMPTLLPPSHSAVGLSPLAQQRVIFTSENSQLYLQIEFTASVAPTGTRLNHNSDYRLASSSHMRKILVFFRQPNSQGVHTHLARIYSTERIYVHIGRRSADAATRIGDIWRKILVGTQPSSGGLWVAIAVQTSWLVNAFVCRRQGLRTLKRLLELHTNNVSQLTNSERLFGNSD